MKLSATSLINRIPILALLVWVLGLWPVLGDLYPKMQPPLVNWVENGNPLAVIVAQKPAQGTFAADELNHWLQRITGAKLPVVEAAPARGPRVFLGSKTAWEKLGADPAGLKLGREGYVIRSVGSDLVIVGDSNLGTLYGAYAFLEHYLGCRWFWPGETGQVWPKTATLAVGQIDETSKPDFAVRWDIRDEGCGRFNRCNTGLSEPGMFTAWRLVHTWLHLVEPKRYWAEHPEYYALVKGKRVDPTANRGQVNVCTTHPKVLEAVLQTIDEIMAANPATDMISVDPMDTQNFCQCENCLQLQNPEAPYESRNSRLVFEFSNRVAERVAQKYPRLLIKTIAYHTYLAPPPFKMRDNVIIQFCRFMCHNHVLTDDTCPESSYFNRQLLAWRDHCRQLMLYEYYNKGSWCGLPWPIVHSIRGDIPYLHEHGATALSTQWNENHANNGLDYYVAAKLLWNTRLDVEALLTDFYEKSYAEAAAPMRRYHERLENTLAQSGLHVAAQSGYRAMHQFLSANLLSALTADLREARQIVRDPGAAKRVELMARGFHYATLVADYLNPIAQAMGTRATSWNSPSSADLPALEKVCAPLLQEIQKYSKSKANAGAVPSMSSYQERLLSVRTVVAAWNREGDRPTSRSNERLTKVEWLKTHPQPLHSAPPQSLALWIYANDIDYAKPAGPEHLVMGRGRDGQRVMLDKIGRPNRDGNRKDLAFISPKLNSTQLDLDPLQITIENPPGGPYSSVVFALYLMPDDGTTEDEATAQIQNALETVRRRAAAFVEYRGSGQAVTENQALESKLVIPGFPKDAFSADSGLIEKP